MKGKRFFTKLNQQSFSEYIQEALVQTMKSDIEDGNLLIARLERLDDREETEKSNTDQMAESINSMSFLDELTKLNQQTMPKVK